MTSFQSFELWKEIRLSSLFPFFSIRKINASKSLKSGFHFYMQEVVLIEEKEMSGITSAAAATAAGSSCGRKKSEWDGELAVSQPQISLVLGYVARGQKEREREEKACKRVGGKCRWLLNWGWTAVWLWSATVALAIQLVQMKDSAILCHCQLEKT